MVKSSYSTKGGIERTMFLFLSGLSRATKTFSRNLKKSDKSRGSRRFLSFSRSTKANKQSWNICLGLRWPAPMKIYLRMETFNRLQQRLLLPTSRSAISKSGRPARQTSRSASGSRESISYFFTTSRSSTRWGSERISTQNILGLTGYQLMGCLKIYKCSTWSRLI